MPEQYRQYWTTWHREHLGWSLFTWGDQSIADFGILNRHEYDNAPTLAARKDIAAMEILHRMGGVIVDCDFECFKNIEPLIDEVSAFAAWQRPVRGQPIANVAIMGCTKGNEDFAKLVGGIPESFRLNRDTASIAGPFYLTRRLPEMEAFTVLEEKYLYPYTWTEQYQGRDAYPEAYAAHHWAGGWS